MTLQKYDPVAIAPRATPPPGPGLVREDPLSEQDYEAIKTGIPNWRDLLLTKTLKGTGLRLSELLRVQVKHIGNNGPDIFLWVIRGKKKGEPVWEPIVLPAELATELRAYITGLSMKPEDRIWKVSRYQYWRVFSAAGRRVLGRDVHPHQLRALYIKTVIDRLGANLPQAAQMVGHTSSRTTEQWYYRLTAQQRAEIQRRMPV